jgi:hypothetical protein
MRSGLPVLGLLAAGAIAAACGAAAAHLATPAATAHAAAARQAPPAAATRWPDGARYDLDLRYDRRRFTISGTERITFRNTGPSALPAVWLRTWANAFGGCRVSRAHVTIRAGGTLGARRESCTALEVRLPQPLAPGAETTIAL